MTRPAPEELVVRLKAADPSLWGPPETPELANRLGWVNLPVSMRPQLAELEDLARAVVDEGVEDVVLLGMGGSSLAPEVFASVLGTAPGHPSLTVLDSTHPDQIRSVADAIDPQQALFVVSSKSGTTLETLAGFRYFWPQTGENGDRFIAITDPGSPLQRLAEERGFRAVLTAPADVGGRFSALTPFGLFPAALIGADLSALLDSAAAADWYRGVVTGYEWADQALVGRDKLTMITSAGMAGYPNWVEQLVAESLGKDGKGIVPVVSEPRLDRYGEDRLFIELRLDGEPLIASPAGHPVIRREISGPYGLGAEMVEAEVATAVAGFALGVHPFNQPHVELAKQRARQALDTEVARIDLLEIHSPVLADQLDDFMARIETGGYFAIHAYLPSDDATVEMLGRMRYRIGNRAGTATTVGFGPRFLHSTGQLHKGGTPNGVFLQIVDQPEQDLEIPEMDTTFGRVIAAQALGDYLALRERGRRVLRIDLGPSRRKGLETLLDAIG